MPGPLPWAPSSLLLLRSAFGLCCWGLALLAIAAHVAPTSAKGGRSGGWAAVGLPWSGPQRHQAGFIVQRDAWHKHQSIEKKTRGGDGAALKWMRRETVALGSQALRVGGRRGRKRSSRTLQMMMRRRKRTEAPPPQTLSLTQGCGRVFLWLLLLLQRRGPDTPAPVYDDEQAGPVDKALYRFFRAKVRQLTHSLTRSSLPVCLPHARRVDQDS